MVIGIKKTSLEEGAFSGLLHKILAENMGGIIQKSRGFWTCLLSKIFEKCLFSSLAYLKKCNFLLTLHQMAPHDFHHIGVKGIQNG